MRVDGWIDNEVGELLDINKLNMAEPVKLES